MAGKPCPDSRGSEGFVLQTLRRWQGREPGWGKEGHPPRGTGTAFGQDRGHTGQCCFLGMIPPRPQGLTGLFCCQTGGDLATAPRPSTAAFLHAVTLPRAASGLLVAPPPTREPAGDRPVCNLPRALAMPGLISALKSMGSCQAINPQFVLQRERPCPPTQKKNSP